MNAALRDGAELEESKSFPTSILFISGVHNVFILLLQTRMRKKVKLMVSWRVRLVRGLPYPRRMNS